MLRTARYFFLLFLRMRLARSDASIAAPLSSFQRRSPPRHADASHATLFR